MLQRHFQIRCCLILPLCLAGQVGCDQGQPPPEESVLSTYEVWLEGEPGVVLDMRVTWLDATGIRRQHEERVTPPWSQLIPIAVGVRADFRTIEPKPAEEGGWVVELLVNGVTRAETQGRSRPGHEESGAVASGQAIEPAAWAEE